MAMIKFLTDTKEVLEEIRPEEVTSFFQSIMPRIIDVGQKIIVAVIVLLVGVKIISMMRKLVKRSLTRANVDAGVLKFIDSLTKVSLFIVLVAIIASTFNPRASTSFIALLGSAGLAIGLALQGSISNFAGGVLILLLKPFKVGDYIIEDTKKNEGIVTEIELFYTKLKTIDNRIVVIPNGILANNSLTNNTAQDRRRLTIKVGISYQADILKAKAILQQIINQEDTIIKEEETHIYVDELAESCVKLGLICWIKTEEFMMTKWRMTESIKLEFDRANISIPFNQLDVTVKNATQN